MVARLVAEEGELKGLVLSLETGESWTIGRDPEQCELVIGDPLASRRHVVARRTPEGILVENLSTTNPLQVNEEIVEEPRLLQNGDTLKIGSEIFRFYLDNTPMENTTNSLENNHLLNGSETAVSEVSKEPNHPPSVPEQEAEDNEDTIFDAGRESPQLADINFNITETGRWLLKVIGGPNTGAEFYMQTGQNYVIGTDPHSCDIVFHDTSVSRQHARINVTEDDTLWIEDLRSRNGVLINNERLLEKQPLSPSIIVSTGTTSFVVYDREGEMQTIISPLLPSIVKVLQKDEAKHEEEEKAAAATVKDEALAPLLPATPKPPRNWGPLILFSIILGLFSLMGIATYSLFKTEPVIEQVRENANELISQVTAQFPSVKFSYNKATGNLLLLGHVSTAADKNQLIYSLQGLNFIKSIDDSGVIIDEFVWREINSVLSRNPAWQGISIHSPAAGEFVLSGYLKTRKQAESLSDDLSLNFPGGGKGTIDVSSMVQDPTKTDTVTKLDLVTSQNVRITGKIEIQKAADGYKVTISLDPDNPNLASTQGNFSSNAGGWFATSFIAAFTNVMSDILSTLRKINWMEAKTERETRVQIFDMAKSQADLTKQNYALQSREAQLQAIQSFISAGVSTVQLGASLSNSNRARKEADERAQPKIDAAQEKVNTYFNKDGTPTTRTTATGASAETTALQAEVTAAKAEVTTSQAAYDADRTPANQAKLNKDKDALVKAEAKLSIEQGKDIAAADKEWVKQGIKAKEEMAVVQAERERDFHNELQHLDSVTNSIAQILNSAVQGAFKMAESRIKTDIGEVEAQKTIQQGLMDMLNKYNENSGKHRDEAKRAFSEFVSGLQQTVHADIQAHMSR